MRAAPWLAAAFLAVALGSGPAAAEKRVALVIGMSAYTGEKVPPLKNPVNDAKLVADRLQKVGFTLIGGGPQLDLDRRSLSKALESFEQGLQSDDVALFYYAGHAIQVKGSNYLVPTEAVLKSEASARNHLVDVDTVLEHMQKARLKLVILDACRDNPFAEATRGGGSGTRGLAEMRDVPKGTVIAFATAPGKTAADGKDDKNSPYTKALADTLHRPGLDIWRTLNETGNAVERATTGRQLPWFHASPLQGEFYFVPPQEVAPAKEAAPQKEAAPPIPVVPPDQAAPDLGPLEFASTRPKPVAPPDQGAAGGPSSGRGESKSSGPGQSGSAPTSEATGPAIPSSDLPPNAGRLAALSAHPTRESLLGKSQFKDCESCPTMVIVPPGRAMIGSPESEPGRSTNEGPQQEILIARPFAVGRSEVSFEEWLSCVAEGGCRAFRPGNYGWGEGKQPVINVSWVDAKAYVEWLSRKTGTAYRLPSEAEWEYAARGCTWTHCPSTPFWFGGNITLALANHNSAYSYNGSVPAQPPRRTVPVDTSQPNPFGLLHVHGNVREWTEDCWNVSLAGVPRDGSARTSGDCNSHVVRGGSWSDEPKDLRSAKRGWEIATERRAQLGFRVARSCRNPDATATGRCD